MEINDEEPKVKAAEAKNLEILSIEAIFEYIGELEEEISRARKEITYKEKAKAGAEKIFKS